MSWRTSQIQKPGRENRDKQLRSISLINCTTDFEFCETSFKSLSAKLWGGGSLLTLLKLEVENYSLVIRKNDHRGTQCWHGDPSMDDGVSLGRWWRLGRGCFISHLLKCVSQFCVVRKNETQSYITVGETVTYVRNCYIYIYIYTHRETRRQIKRQKRNLLIIFNK